MVKALQDGSKTQTRRIIKPQPDEFKDDWPWTSHDAGDGIRTGYKPMRCPYGVVGDRLWVRETHYRYGRWLKNGLTKTGRQKWKFKALDIARVRYLDDPPPELAVKRRAGWHKRPSIFMPRKLSRLTLELTGVRAERLQDISREDAISEGIAWCDYQNTSGDKCERCGARLFSDDREPPWHSPIIEYQILWDSLHGKGAWECNDWVWVLEFKKL